MAVRKAALRWESLEFHPPPFFPLDPLGAEGRRGRTTFERFSYGAGNAFFSFSVEKGRHAVGPSPRLVNEVSESRMSSCEFLRRMSQNPENGPPETLCLDDKNSLFSTETLHLGKRTCSLAAGALYLCGRDVLYLQRRHCVLATDSVSLRARACTRAKL